MHGPGRRRPSHAMAGQTHQERCGQCFEHERGNHGERFTIDPDVNGLVRVNLESWGRPFQPTGIAANLASEFECDETSCGAGIIDGCSGDSEDT
jgi:hypothetical protein